MGVYSTLIASELRALIEGETDEIALMATIVGALHHGLDHFDWTGFYRVVAPDVLKIGPYQGGHGCLTIPFDQGVCCKCARDGQTQIVPDVREVPYHLACSGSTRAEIVVPVFDPAGRVRAMLNVDSDRVDLLRRLGLKVFYGDASREDLLRTAGAAKASLLVLALDSPEKTLEMVRLARAHFPHLTILARASDRADAYELLDAGSPTKASCAAA